MDKLTFMLMCSPTFVDDSGYFPEQNIENSFAALHAGLHRLRLELGEALFQKLSDMSERMRAYFEADPEDTTGETRQGKRLVLDMEELVEARIASQVHSVGTAPSPTDHAASIVEGRDPVGPPYRPYIPQTPSELGICWA